MTEAAQEAIKTSAKLVEQLTKPAPSATEIIGVVQEVIPQSDRYSVFLQNFLKTADDAAKVCLSAINRVQRFQQTATQLDNPLIRASLLALVARVVTHEER